ncbi:MAG: protein arginine kinase [Firmicutes bacterium]|nr:protein arginine kinase [Bacillota bacterium]
MNSKQKKISLKVSEWLRSPGPDGDIVLSSRVRLARNLRDIPFPYLASDSQSAAVLKKVRAMVPALAAAYGPLKIFTMDELDSLERQVLVEKHLISPALANNQQHNSAVLLRDDEVISIMVNEEDHLRIQCLLPGLQLERALQLAGDYDDLLEEKLDYAFDEQWGYLTVCPTNVGTGLRASVMMHLPALMLTKQANRILQAIAQVGLAVRGIYGEGSEIKGNLVQISNQITLGQSGEEIVRNLYGVAKQVVEQETQARQILLNEGRDRIADRVNRSLGTLRYARLISSEEAMQLLSDVRLGVDLGLIEEVVGSILKELLLLHRPAYLQYLTGRNLDSFDRDRVRAKLIRLRLAGKHLHEEEE